jgi:hypothetical protein
MLSNPFFSFAVSMSSLLNATAHPGDFLHFYL